MAARVQELCRLVVERYDGDAARVWTEAKSGAELAKRVGELPGFGKQKAQIFVALLAKQFGVRPRGWQEASGIFGENGTFRSVADIIDADSLAKVRRGSRRESGRVSQSARCVRRASSSRPRLATGMVPTLRRSRP